MLKRKIIKIDEEKCNGCGNCIPNCPEGAILIIDGKARLVSDLFCDGLGACIGECPIDAITIEERAAEPYDEIKVMDNIVKQGKNVIEAHLEHLQKHNETQYLEQAVSYLKKNNIEISGGYNNHDGYSDGSIVKKSESIENNRNTAESENICPGSRIIDFTKSELRQWPVQINLVSPSAAYFKDADLVIAADCVPFTYASFHRDFLKGKILLIGCPKFDDTEYYMEKITEIFRQNEIKSVTVVHMEVPCCFGLKAVIKEALKESGKNIPLKEINISIKGEILAQD
jgi:ferredoxin